MLELLLMCVLALTPIIWLVVALIVFKMSAHLASLGSLIVAALAATLAWHITPLNLGTAALEGALMALWPIGIVIIAAVFTYNVTVKTGSMDVIKQQLCAISPDTRVLALIIAWCFGAFLEGMAGFGTAVAIPASMLVALGLPAQTALLTCMVANGVPTMFGSIGIPTTTLSTITGIDPSTLATWQALQAAPFVIACPFIIVCITGGGLGALKGVMKQTIAAGVVFSVAEVLTGMFIGGELPDIVGAAAALAMLVLISMRTPTSSIDPRYLLSEGQSTQEAVSVGRALRSWASFGLIFLVLLATSKINPLVYGPLSSIKSVVNIYAGNPKATLTFSWINTPGVLIFMCGMVGGLIQGASFATMGRVLAATVKQMSKTVFTMVCVLAVAKIMGYAGMIASIADFFVEALGPAYPLVAPVLGALGTFVTGSGTSSEVLFGSVQQHAAQAIGANQTWLVAANSLGTSAGKMMCPQNIAIGCSTVGLEGQDGKTMATMAPYAFAFAAGMAVLIFVGSLILH